MRYLNIFAVLWYWSVKQFTLYGVDPKEPSGILRPDLRQAALREMDVKGSWKGFIYPQLMPVSMVDERSATYTIIRKKGSGFGKVQNTKVAKGGSFGRSNWSYDEDSYFCEKHGWEHDVPFEDVLQYKSKFNAMRIGTELTIDVVTRSREFEVAKLLMDATAGYAKYTMEKPVNDTSCTPITEWGNAIEQMQFGSQKLKPNVLVISEPALRRAMRTEEVKAFYKDTNPEKTLPGTQTASMMTLLGIDKIIIPKADMERDIDGTPTLKPIWPQHKALLLRVAPGSTMVNDRVLGWTRAWSRYSGSEYTIDSYQRKESEVDVVRCKSYASSNITCSDAIMHIDGVLDLETILNDEGLDLSSFND